MSECCGVIWGASDSVSYTPQNTSQVFTAGSCPTLLDPVWASKVVGSTCRYLPDSFPSNLSHARRKFHGWNNTQFVRAVRNVWLIQPRTPQLVNSNDKGHPLKPVCSVLTSRCVIENTKYLQVIDCNFLKKCKKSALTESFNRSRWVFLHEKPKIPFL